MGIFRRIISLFSNGPAIQNLENFDMVVELHDGGIILPIVCSQHLDESDGIFSLLTTKISNYVTLAHSSEFKENYPSPAYIQIQLECIKTPDQRIISELDRFENSNSGSGIKLTWRT